MMGSLPMSSVLAAAKGSVLYGYGSESFASFAAGS